MTRKEYIEKNKKSNLILLEHSEWKDKGGEPLRQYLPAASVQPFQDSGWVVISDVETPPEAIGKTLLTEEESIQNDTDGKEQSEQISTEISQPKPKGRPKTNA